jgi:hypothetical protein
MADESRSNPIREERFSWDNPNDIEVIKVGKQPPTPKAKPPGDSQEQQDAEGVMIAAFGETRGVDLKSETVSLGDGVTVQVDGVAADRSVFCEAFAHQGALRGSQPDKVVSDAFKLAFLARRWPEAELFLLFSDEVASRRFLPQSKSWVAKAIAELGVKAVVVEVPEALREKLRQVQDRQGMVPKKS